MADSPWRVRTKLLQGPPGPTKLTSGSVSWTPGTIAGGAFSSVAVPVTAAVVGQSAVPGFSLPLPAGVLASASVTAAGVVTVSLFNFSGSPVTLAAGTAWADVLVH